VEMMFDEPMMAEDMEINFAPMERMEKMVNVADEEKDMGEAAPSTANDMKEVSAASSLDAENTVYDFMGTLDEHDFRQYTHQLRKDFNPTSPIRVDFTETVAFVAGTKFTASSGSRVQVKVPSFYLGEQTTQFIINVDLYSS
jgi:hypothetical protein